MHFVYFSSSTSKDIAQRETQRETHTFECCDPRYRGRVPTRLSCVHVYIFQRTPTPIFELFYPLQWTRMLMRPRALADRWRGHAQGHHGLLMPAWGKAPAGRKRTLIARAERRALTTAHAAIILLAAQNMQMAAARWSCYLILTRPSEPSAAPQQWHHDYALCTRNAAGSAVGRESSECTYRATVRGCTCHMSHNNNKQ